MLVIFAEAVVGRGVSHTLIYSKEPQSAITKLQCASHWTSCNLLKNYWSSAETAGWLAGLFEIAHTFSLSVQTVF